MAKWTTEQHKKYFLRALNKTVKSYDKDAEVRYIEKDSPNPDAIGYTSADKIIYLGWSHPILKGLKITEKKRILRGTFTHELLHLLFTNFSVLNRTLNRMQAEKKHPIEIRVLASINNLMEDPYIEHNAYRAIGGTLLRDLRYSIRYFYEKSPELSKDMDPFSQYESALIMFGDMGVIKGKFYDSMAAKCFSDSAETFYNNLSEDSAYGRMDNAFKLLDISRPLWEKMVEDAEKAMEALKEALKRHFISELSEESESEGDGKMSEPTKKPSSSEKRMKKLVKDLSEIGSSKEESGEESSDEESDSESAAPPEEKDESSEDTSKGTSSETPESDEPSESEGATGSESDASPESEDSTETKDFSEGEGSADEESEGESTSDDATGAGGTSDTSDSSDGTSDAINDLMSKAFEEAKEELKKEEEELKTSEEDRSTDEKEVESGKRAEEKEKAEKEVAEYDPSIGTLYDKDLFSVLNVNAAQHYSSAYHTLFSRMEKRYGGCIHGFVKRMKRVFANVAEDRVYGKKGKLSVKRYMGPQATTNIFRKKVEPEDISDLCVMILVDESGSMSVGDVSAPEYSRDEVSKNLAGSLAKAFTELDIPTYVMGYTGEGKGYDAEHYHYLKWKKSQRDLESIMGISAKCQNFDSFSFSCGNEILKKRNEEHKLVIIISDGTPACCSPMGRVGSGAKLLSDTSLAIREMRRQADVISVCVGAGAPAERLKFLYGKNFFSIDSTKTGFLKISNEIEKIVKKW